MIHEEICNCKPHVVGRIHKFMHQIQLGEYVYMNQALAHAVLSRRELLIMTQDIGTELTCPVWTRLSEDSVGKPCPSLGGWLRLDKMKALDIVGLSSLTGLFSVGSGLGPLDLQKWVLVPIFRE